MDLRELRDRFSGKRRLVLAVAAPLVWLGASAATGQLEPLDLVWAAILGVVFGYTARPRKPKADDPRRGIYGPPE